jgi:hypothetical protein
LISILLAFWNDPSLRVHCCPACLPAGLTITSIALAGNGTFDFYFSYLPNIPRQYSTPLLTDNVAL